MKSTLLLTLALAVAAVAASAPTLADEKPSTQASEQPGELEVGQIAPDIDVIAFEVTNVT